MAKELFMKFEGKGVETSGAPGRKVWSIMNPKERSERDKPTKK